MTGIEDPNLTELQAVKAKLSVTEQRNRDLERENAVLAQRAALAVDQEANVKQIERLAETITCYRCEHTLKEPDDGCACCSNNHTPNQDGEFT